MYPLRVIDRDFNFLGMIADYTSVMIDRKAYEVGSVEIRLQPKDAACPLTRGVIAYIDPKAPVLIGRVQQTESAKGLEYVAFGQQLKGICGRRLTVPDTEDDQGRFGYDRFPAPEDPDAPAETIIKHYADKHMFSPSDPSRAFPRLQIAPDQGRGPAARWSSRFESLSEVYRQIGEYSGLGYDISLDIDAKVFVFDVIYNVDHSIGSSAPVVFAPKYGNLSSITYETDDKSLVSAAYAGGAGEGETRLIQAVFAGETIPAGFERREAWIDCGNIEYYDDLIYEAQHRLTDKTVTESLTGTAALSGPFLYGRDWDVGHIVTIQSGRLGIEREAQITAVTETYQGQLRKLALTFGRRQKNLLDEIRKKEVAR